MQDDPQGYPKLDIKAARALSPRTQTIRIESILGGQSPTKYFGRKDQFYASLGIDPSLPVTAPGVTPYAVGSSGMIRQSPWNDILQGIIQNVPLWLRPNPKTSSIFVHDAQGSVYTSDSGGGVTALSDAGSMSNSIGNGAEYYDNYMYFAKNTDIARYGPLDGSPTFNATYWTSTLSKAALTNTTYPRNFLFNFLHASTVRYPNHVMHRHSDGKLYIADVVGNQGTIHTIQTTKSTVEGDTDNGSTFGKLSFGYGLWPTAMESYGSSIAIALYEGALNVATPVANSRAKIAFWDTTSQNFNSITWVEYPDSFITGMKNVDGVLYIISGDTESFGFRVFRYVGGSTVQEVATFSDSPPPFAGGIDGRSNQLIFGGYTYLPEERGVLYSLGLPKNLSTGIFTLMASPGATQITAVTIDATQNYAGVRPYLVGFSTGQSGTANNSLASRSFTSDTGYSNSPSVMWFPVQRIGQPFKITKIRIPLATVVASGMTVIPKIYTDDGVGLTYTLQTINNTNYPGKKNIVIRPENLSGDHNFWLELRWTGNVSTTVGLPITIEFETIDD